MGEKKVMYDSLVKGYDYQVRRYRNYIESGHIGLADDALGDIKRVKRRIRNLIDPRKWYEFWWWFE